MLWTTSRYMHEMSISNRLWLLYYQSCRHFSFKGSTRVRMDRTNSRIALSELGARRSSLHMLGLIHLLDPFFLKVSSRCSGAAGFLMDILLHLVGPVYFALSPKNTAVRETPGAGGYPYLFADTTILFATLFAMCEHIKCILQ
jgi:hypothetical protein